MHRNKIDTNRQSKKGGLRLSAYRPLKGRAALKLIKLMRKRRAEEAARAEAGIETAEAASSSTQQPKPKPPPKPRQPKPKPPPRMESTEEGGGRPKRQAAILPLPYYHKEYPTVHYQPAKKPKEVKKPAQKAADPQKVENDPPIDVAGVFAQADQLGYEVDEEDEDELGDEEFACSLLDRRLVDVPFFMGQLLQFRSHQGSRGKCNFHDMVVRSERRHGLNSCYSFQCKTCHRIEPVWTNRPRLRPVNREVVRGAVHHLDGDLVTLNKFLGSCGVPAVPEDIFMQEKGLMTSQQPAAKKQGTFEVDLSVVKQEPPDVDIEFESVCSVIKTENVENEDHLMVDNDRDYLTGKITIRDDILEQPTQVPVVKLENPIVTNPFFLKPKEITKKLPPPPPAMELPKPMTKNRQLSVTSFTFEGHNDPVPAVPEVNLFAYHPELFSAPTSSYKPSEEEIKTEARKNLPLRRDISVPVKKEKESEPKQKRKFRRYIQDRPPLITAGRKDPRVTDMQPVSEPECLRLGNKRPNSERNYSNVKRKTNGGSDFLVEDTGSTPTLQSGVGSKSDLQAANVAPLPARSNAAKDVPEKREKPSKLLPETSSSHVVNFGSLSILPVASTKDISIQPAVPKKTHEKTDPGNIKTIPPPLGSVNIGSISICPINTTVNASSIELGSSMSILPVTKTPSISVQSAVTENTAPSMSVQTALTENTAPLICQPFLGSSMSIRPIVITDTTSSSKPILQSLDQTPFNSGSMTVLPIQTENSNRIT